MTKAEKRINTSKSIKRDLRSLLRFVANASSQLDIVNMPIGQISRKHMKLLLAQIEAIQGFDSAHRYDKNRSFLMMLFKELVELEAVETNPVLEISKKQREVPIRTTLTPEERVLTNT